MFATIFRYELKFWLRRPAVYLYSAVFFVMAFVFFAGSTGFFDGPSSGGQLAHWYNAPYEINFILQYFNKFFLFLIPALIGNSIYKDYQTQAHSILYSFPLRKTDYLFGHFCSALLLVFLITLSVVLALILANLLPGLDTNKTGPIRPLAYIQTYLLYIFPNMLISGLLVFAIVLRTRNIFAGFGMVLFLILLQKILENVFYQQAQLIALTDPFGQNTIAYLTQYWTLEERNTRMLPIANLIIWNRFLWLSSGLLAFLAAGRWFRFHEAISSFIILKKKKQANEKPRLTPLIDNAASVKLDFSVPIQLKTVWFLSNFDYRFVLRSWLFWGLTVLGLSTVLFTLNRVSNQAEMSMYSATQLILSAPTILYTTVVLLITFVYSGLLIHRERTAKIDNLVNISSQPTWLFISAKFLSILKIQLSLLGALLLVCVAFQAWNGFTDFRLDLYGFHLFILLGLELMIWAIISVFFHTLFPNLYLALFFLLLGWIGIQGLATLGVVSPLLLFNINDPLLYSDLNAYGQNLLPFFYKKVYWLLFSLLFAILAYTLWPRQLQESSSQRFKMFQQQFKGPVRIAFGMILLTFSGMAFDFHYKNKVSQIYSSNSLQKIYKDFQANFDIYSQLPQPKIKSVFIELDFYPDQQHFSANGKYQLQNPYPFALDTIFVKSGFDEITELQFGRQAQLIAEDPDMKFQVYKLNQSLAPGDSLSLQFEIKNQANSFFTRHSNVLRNGTLLGQDAFPRLMFPSDAAAPLPSDSLSRQRHYQAADAGLITFEAVVSAPKGQTILAPGSMIDSWTNSDRQYAHFKVEAPIEYSFGFHAGELEQSSEQWKGVQLDVFHHAKHAYNVTDMMAGMKASLNYNQEHFGPYQHKAASIVEFPNSEGSFATTYGNIVPISEVRFLSKVEENGQKVNLAFYIPAHELTHQWWGSQLLPAHAQGALMLTESIAEYISLNIYRNQFGETSAQQFLALQRQRYLNGRSREQVEEPPLYLVGKDQPYLAYGKGTMAFHTLAHYLGEEKLNGILKQFLEQYRFQEAPYPTSLDLLELLEQETPKDLQFILEDYFKKVCFHEVKLESARQEQTADGSFELLLDIDYQKTEAPAREPFNDLLEVGLYNTKKELIKVELIQLELGQQQVRLNIPEKVASVLLDPNTLLIELDRNDNRKNF